jgi:uncharacterized OsmC-like protein/alpha/beta superfamily hydrolase
MMAATKVTFENPQGEIISAAIDWPQGETQAFAIFAHCFTCSKDLFASRHVSNELTTHGIAVMRFDFTGLGRSQGAFEDTNFTSNISDIVAAADWLADKYSAPTLLVGHSLGGAAVLAAAPEIESVKAVATIGAPASAEHVLHQFDASLEEIRANGVATVDIGGRPFPVKSQFIDDVSGDRLTGRVTAGKAAKLILHSPLDAIVGIENAELIFKAARHPKSFISLDNADHLLSQKSDAIYVATIIASWASRFIALPKEPLKAEGHVAAVESGEGPYHLNINASGHALTADEPESVGGTNRGPTPYDLLCAALGACTTITLRMYATRKKMAVDEIETQVDHDKEHASDAHEEGKKGAKVDVFTRRIKIIGDIDEDQRARMLQIADLCPVHKTLEKNAHVRSELI